LQNFLDDESMSLSETIIKIHSIASETVGDLEADEFIMSLLVVTINDLKKMGELNSENLEAAFEKKHELVENSQMDFELTRPKLFLLSNE
jgi:hypothetical protein